MASCPPLTSSQATAASNCTILPDALSVAIVTVCSRLTADIQQRMGLLSTAEVAAVLGVHPVSVARYVRAGTLPARRIGQAGPLRFQAADVERLLQPARPATTENEETP